MARSIAVVPEIAQLPFEMPVEEVVALGRLPHEPPLTGLRPSDHAAVDAAIERVGIGHLRARDARELSMGERQLVFIALALAQAAPILVLDEPTAHLDIRHQVEVMQLLVDLNERDGTTIVAVLHDLALAAHFFPRIVADGPRDRIVADGPPADDPRRRSASARSSGSTRRSSACRWARRERRRVARRRAARRGPTDAVGGFAAAVGFLTRLPVGERAGAAAATSPGAAAFGLVGGLVGAVVGLPMLLVGGARRRRSPRSWRSRPARS